MRFSLKKLNRRTILIVFLVASFLFTGSAAFASLTFDSTSVSSDGSISIGSNGQTIINSKQRAPSVPSAPVLAGAGAGNVNNGTHRYKFTFSDSDGHETEASAATAAVTVVDNTSNGKVTVSVPYVCDSLLPNVGIYRDNNNDGIFKLVETTFFECATTYEDNTANSSLGAVAPTTSNADVSWTFQGDTLIPPTSSDWGAPVIFVPKDTGIFAQDAPQGEDGGTLEISGSYADSGNGGNLFFAGGQGHNHVGGDIIMVFGFGTTQGNFKVQHGNTVPSFDINGQTDAATFAGILQAGGFKSSDGSAGLTVTKTVKGSAGTNCDLTFKNGLLTATTCP